MENFLIHYTVRLRQFVDVEPFSSCMDDYGLEMIKSHHSKILRGRVAEKLLKALVEITK
jgi:hypothetical protein